MAIPQLTTRLTIRLATPADFASVSGLLQSYYREGDVLGGDSDDQLRALLAYPDPGFCVAMIDDTVCGCLLCRRLATLAHACECKRMFVAPDARRLGVASGLMDFAEHLAQKAGFAWMHLDSKDNFAAALAMYRARGYQDCERFNQNPEATVFLRKPLSARQCSGLGE